MIRPAALICLLVVFGAMQARAQTPDNDQAKRFTAEGRVMFWGDDVDQQGSPDHSGATDFFIRRARLVLQGRLGESISVFFQVGQDNIGAHVLTADRGISVKDAYVNVRALGGLQFVAGQFKIPFLRANLESGFNQILVDRGTLPTLRPAREGSRDLGLMAWGDVGRLQYRLAVFDGSDQEESAAASGRRVTARVAHNWFSPESGLVYTGSHLGTRRILQVAIQADLQRARSDPRDDESLRALPRDYRALAVEAFAEQPFGNWAVTADAAWLDREDDYVDVSTPTRDLRGYYAQAGLLLPPRTGPGRLQLAFRREDWDVERGFVPVGVGRTTVGGTYYLDGHARKLQADYTIKRETPEADNNELRISLVLVF